MRCSLAVCPRGSLCKPVSSSSVGKSYLSSFTRSTQSAGHHHLHNKLRTRDLLGKTQEGDDLCLGKKQQGTERELCLYRVSWGRSFQGETSSPELVARSAIGGIWALLGFQA